MATLTKVTKQVTMGLGDVIKYQIMTHCFISSVNFSNNELDCLTLLGLSGPIPLSEFCKLSVERKIFKSSQTVRNFLTRVEKDYDMIEKFSGKVKGKDRMKVVKIINLHSDLQIQTKDGTLLNYVMINPPIVKEENEAEES